MFNEMIEEVVKARLVKEKLKEKIDRYNESGFLYLSDDEIINIYETISGEKVKKYVKEEEGEENE